MLVGDKAVIRAALGRPLGRLALLEPSASAWPPDPRIHTHGHRLHAWTLRSCHLGEDCWLVESRADWEWTARSPQA